MEEILWLDVNDRLMILAYDRTWTSFSTHLGTKEYAYEAVIILRRNETLSGVVEQTSWLSSSPLLERD